MKVVRYESPKCQFCGSSRVTVFEKGTMIGCSDCCRSTGYEKVPPVEKGNPKMNIRSEGGEVSLYVMFIFCVIILVFSIRVINRMFLDDLDKPEPKKIEKVSVGDCFTFKNDAVNIDNSCTNGAPEWENESNYRFMFKILEIGVNKVKVIAFRFTCTGKYIEDSSYTSVDKLSLYQGESAIMEKMECIVGP